ncbi:DUF2442 domain-containing protein [Sporolactobacillus sp. STSJ-5]|uniref:DUF2442 domain-containing protein n=1 Tax=Sporolactobacillus sp. STSJ-5 TaxID=2965076 RepID=UPI00210462C4|nr:DUF2442 domain-containing protein [Sporolactobacillus sp. STSJ-5]MCQ2011169.1 DUF2442 domain-containing protein [Sporolactobacillus sp. STSJ-5]
MFHFFHKKKEQNEETSGDKFKPIEYLTTDEKEMFRSISSLTEKSTTSKELKVIKFVMARFLELSLKRYKTCSNDDKIITDVLPLKDARLLLIFNYRECRIIDLKTFLNGSKGIVNEILTDPKLFQSVKIDNEARTIAFENQVDFDPGILYVESVAL